MQSCLPPLSRYTPNGEYKIRQSFAMREKSSCVFSLKLMRLLMPFFFSKCYPSYVAANSCRPNIFDKCSPQFSSSRSSSATSLLFSILSCSKSILIPLPFLDATTHLSKRLSIVHPSARPYLAISP